MNLSRGKYLAVTVALFATVTSISCAQTAARHEPTATNVPQPTSTPEPTPTPSPEPPAPTPEPTATPQAEPTATPTVVATPVGSPTPIPVSNVQTHALSLQIEGIRDESTVRDDLIVLRGLTAPDAIVSINGVIVVVDETGRFEVPLLLDPGPNQIVVVASDLDGNNVSTSFLVVSLPEEEEGEAPV